MFKFLKRNSTAGGEASDAQQTANPEQVEVNLEHDPDLKHGKSAIDRVKGIVLHLCDFLKVS